MAGGSVHLSGRPEPCPERFNAARYCLAAGAEGAEALTAVDPASGAVRRWSFGEARVAVRRAAGACLEAGVRPGDRVVLLLGDVPEFPLAWFGAMAAGAVAAPLSSQLSPGEIAAIMEDAAPALVVAPRSMDLPGGVARLTAQELLSGPEAEIADTGREDPALLVFTSGSGGRPKGVLHAQRSIWARRSMRTGWHGIGPGDRVMHAGAFNWTFTLGVALADTWSVGATAVLNAGDRSAEVWPRLARDWEPTVFAGAPAVYRRILKYGTGLREAFATLRHAITAGEALSPAIADGWTEATGKPLLEALGMSEISTYVSTPPGRAARGLAGWPQPGRQVAVLGEDGMPVPYGETGELAVHASDSGLMLGYWRQPDLTRAAYRGDWFATGDMVRMREDGAIAYAGRKDDQMNAQGYRVDPGEVEAALSSCPGVAECGVAELEVSVGLSVIAGWVVGEVDRATLLAHAGERLAGYKMPREVFRAEALPHSANGKLLRRRLRELPRTPL
jgi:acyl-coenzyme A synthetase/AMP-(fatty) acid ligase